MFELIINTIYNIVFSVPVVLVLTSCIIISSPIYLPSFVEIFGVNIFVGPPKDGILKQEIFSYIEKLGRRYSS